MSSTLYIDLTKLQHNLEAINKRLRKNVKKMAVIKDNAYGHGFLPIAHFLKDKVEWFCVARLEEAIQLRENGIRNSILVFEIPSKVRAEEYVKYNITASICDPSDFEHLKEGTLCHIKFDTGMGRLGIRPQDVSLVLEKMAARNDLKFTGIYTHFANATEIDHPRINEQLELFRQIRAQFPSHWMTHTANSGAIFYYEDYDLQFDAVRPGVSLLGYSPGDHGIADLEIIAEWRTTLSQVKKIDKGESVGYGGRWNAPADGWLGIIPVGYAQGLSRNLSGKINVQINDKLYPQVGTISMDYSAIFLANDAIERGAEVVLLNGTNLTARTWANVLETIPYEIITRISQD